MPTTRDCLATGRLTASSDRIYPVPNGKRALLTVSYANTSDSLACHVNMTVKSIDSPAALRIGKNTDLPAKGTLEVEVSLGSNDILFGDSDGAVDYVVQGTLEDA